MTSPLALSKISEGAQRIRVKGNGNDAQSTDCLGEPQNALRGIAHLLARQSARDSLNALDLLEPPSSASALRDTQRDPTRGSER